MTFVLGGDGFGQCLEAVGASNIVGDELLMEEVLEMTETGTERDVREVATKRLQKRRALTGHALVYVLVNTACVVIWLMTGHEGFFWPIFVMVFWGIGLVMNAWDVFFAQEITDEDIDREIARMGHH